ncbi:MAG: polysaccharide biosynthesis/export family protein [Acidobacteria bacterium]|uniref:Polysaccharide biosynthesis/export family protein n=1 Tax=Candidatus Polarisedimenticola svalbardensis TaxID=2886004 RepID=A0A8J6Y3B6_9BACT|nr:polysaccharide biosynthesis/export family protein [Candidatus Polarisedimenticola svalbardensis]
MKRRAFSADWRSAGFSRGLMILLAVVVFLPGSAGENDVTAGSAGPAELSFSIPEGMIPNVGVSLEEGGLTVRLPPGAGVPEDIVAESRGLAVSGNLHHEPDGSLRYEIRLAYGTLDQVLIFPGYLVLRLRSQPGAGPGGASARQYHLGVDDRIQITVGGHADLQTLVVVRSNGMISAPLVGEVQAAGRAVQELAGEIADLLEADFLVNPQVDVEVLDYNSQWVLVTGQVVSPKRVFLQGGTTLKEVIAEAGGLTSFAGSRILVAASLEEAGGGRPPLVVDRRDFEAGRTHVFPRHGSIVNVEKIDYAFIQGEIRSSGTVLLEPGMTLLKAIAISGGMTEWADRKHIRVLDGEGGLPARVYNLKRIQDQKDPDPLIEKGQMIIIPRRFL